MATDDGSAWAIVGDGRMGRAFQARARALGRDCELLAPDKAESVAGRLCVLALRAGRDTRLFLAARVGETLGVLDLTTQSTRDAAAGAELARVRGVAYCAGGVIGGAAEAERGEALLLLGPAPGGALRAMAADLGRPRVYATAALAAAAKLLHNFVLIVQAQALAAALHVADDLGLESFEDLLDAGVTGRRPSQASVVRDLRCGPSTSYTSALVAKDLAALLESFEDLRAVPGIDLPALAAYFAAQGAEPYTTAAWRAAEPRHSA